MPRSPLRPCSHPGCGALTTDGRCAKHPRPVWAKRDYDKARVRGRRLQRRRLDYFSRFPLCAKCEEKGRVSIAEELDHRIPLSEGGTDDESNWQGLCRDCHDQKSREERSKSSAAGS